MCDATTILSYAAAFNIKGHMVNHDLTSTTTPLFSIIIAAYNDWESLDQCLQSLAQQSDGPSFEVIIADDGSTEPAPEFIRHWYLWMLIPGCKRTASRP